MMRAALADAGGNVSAAARRLGVSRMAMRYRMKKHGLRPRRGASARLDLSRPPP